jgi:uncharacterized protein
MKKLFVIIYRPGPSWLEGKPVHEQPIKAHFDYMYALHQSGKIISGGPFSDDTGGIVILEASDREEAMTVMSQDPAVIKRVFLGEVHQWNKVQWEFFDKIRAILKD